MKRYFLRLPHNCLGQCSQRMPLPAWNSPESQGCFLFIILVEFSERPPVWIVRRVLPAETQDSTILSADETAAARSSKETSQQKGKKTINSGPQFSDYQTNTCMYANSIIKCKPYVVDSKGNRVCGSTKGKGPFRGGGKTGFLCGHLEGVDKGHLGIGCYTIPFLGKPHQPRRPQEGILSRADSPTRGGSRFLMTESSNLTLSQHTIGVLFHSIPSPQEWSNEAGDQPKTVKQVGRNTTFQDGDL